MIYNFFNKKAGDTITHIVAGIISKNQQLASELLRGARYTQLIEIPFGELILQTFN